MELHFPALFAAVSINIVNFYDLRLVLYNRNQAINFINLDHVDNLLREEFGKLWGYFFL